jgi:hypothetical protein
MNSLSLILLGTFAAAAVAFVGGAMMWLRHLKNQMANSMRETLNRQITHGQKVEEALQFLQRNQKQMEAQVRTLAEAQGRARADLNVLREKMEQREVSTEQQAASGRILH